MSRRSRPNRIDTFWRHGVIAASGCLEWQGVVSGFGYGYVNGKPVHRLSYERFVGPIPAGHKVDHLCMNRICFNPVHLEAVTHRENIARGFEARGSCPQGHPYTEENTFVVAQTGHRGCLPCRQARDRAVVGECEVCGAGLHRRNKTGRCRQHFYEVRGTESRRTVQITADIDASTS